MDKLKRKLENLIFQYDELEEQVKLETRSMTKEEGEKADSILDMIEATKKEIEREERSSKLKETKTETITEVRSNADLEKYSLGEMIQDAVKSKRTGEKPVRLAEQQKRAISGMSEAVPSDGGFLVDKPLSSTIFEKVYNNGQLASRCFRLPVGANSNGFKIPYIDESSRAAGSRHGGVQAYWLAEGGTKTGSKPKFGLAEFDLKKLAALVYSTDELMQDAVALDAYVSRAVSDELAFKLDDAILNGDGAGKPLGILNSGSLVTVAKEALQTADTIVYENIVKMWSRLHAPSMANSVWIANQDIIPSLTTMSLAVGTGGAPVYLPANGASGMPYQTLMGRPIIFVEQAQTVGDVGDLVLADLSQYYLAEKGGTQFAMSIHVEFIDDETVLRWVYRADGMPIWSTALTPANGSNTQSPFVALAERA